MMDSQRELLERLAASDHLVAMGRIGAGAVAAAIHDLDAKDRRIAELEAALSRYVCPDCGGRGCCPVEHRDINGEYLGMEQVECACTDLKPFQILDAALAAAKREALEAAAVKVKEVAATWSAVAEGTLFQMAREVKP